MAKQTLKVPPRPLTDAKYKTLPKGAILHRVHLSRYRFAEFNPGEGGRTRFAPFYDVSGKIVPSLYATSTLQSAIHETIFHDMPADGDEHKIPEHNIHIRVHSEIQTKRAVNLVELRNPFVKKWGIKQTQLIGSEPELYHKTARWAAAIYNDFPEAEGLIWTSKQCDPDNAILFFGGRVEEGDFELISSRDGDDESFLDDVAREGEECGIAITRKKTRLS